MSGDVGWLIESWAPLPEESRHLHQEIVESSYRGERFDPLEPVPGCGCAICSTYLAGGNDEDARIAVQLVKRLAQRMPAERFLRAESAVISWAEYGCTLPPPPLLVALAGKVPGALREPHTDGDGRDSLPVEAARRADILEVAERLGLGRPEKPYRTAREYLVRCFMHEDHRPSLRLDASKGLWYCDPCASGGDVIELVRRVRGCGFADAVREAAA